MLNTSRKDLNPRVVVTTFEEIRSAGKGANTTSRIASFGSKDESRLPEAMATTSAADVAVVVVSGVSSGLAQLLLQGSIKLGLWPRCSFSDTYTD